MMLIDEKLLVELFEQKDRKRRQALFALFADELLAGLTRARTAALISAKLGRPGLVTADDVRYCRFYFKEKSAITASTKSEPAQKPRPKQSSAPGSNPSGAFKVSDPDEIKLQDQFNYESKFAKKNEN